MEILKVREVCEQPRISKSVVDRLFEQGELEGFRVGGSVRIYAASLLALAERHSNKKPAPPIVIAPKRRGRGSIPPGSFPLLGL
jgi:excisionase family DNA binding protein